MINKPAGILVSGNKFKTVAAALLQNLKASAKLDACKPQPAHRLDFGTTGILLIGKTQSSIRALNKLFEQKEIRKKYHAICIGEMEESGTINSPIAGKESVSKYSKIQSTDSKRFGQLNLLELEPLTGRRHQLRIHLASIGNPILGDKDYGKEEMILKGKGIYLHASKLRFAHPFKKEKIEVESELPRRFRKIFN